MTLSTLRAGAAAVMTVLAAAPLPAAAQESSNVVATEGDWTVFSASNPKECWAVSPPKKTSGCPSRILAEHTVLSVLRAAFVLLM